MPKAPAPGIEWSTGQRLTRRSPTSISPVPQTVSGRQFIAREVPGWFQN
ncbi:MAG: hypothetical protein H5T71_01740, partial [Chloroflexi bacterium]|nr:hypothetical protein [Chloroflexota bacterium]